jgi:gamma-glutamylcyclotransferase (GGCT)/AIG2-like uncharacterized protein YtfP
LAVYGSLAPGEKNACVLDGIAGSWTEGFVRGTLHASGWGAGMGYPGFEPSADGDRIPVKVFTSSELPKHWHRLDEFEGADYRRIVVPVELTGGTLVVAQIYRINAVSSEQ